MARNRTLGKPNPNFGLVPHYEFFLNIFVLAYLTYWGSLFSFSFLGWEASSNGRLEIGFITFSLGILGTILLIFGKGMWKEGIRKHYMMGELVPFLEKKYKVKLLRKYVVQDSLKARTLFKDNDNNPVLFVSWDRIEKEAFTPTDDDLSERVFLMSRLPDGTLVELPYEGQIRPVVIPASDHSNNTH